MAVDVAIDLYPSELKRIYEYVLPALQRSAEKAQDRDEAFPTEVRERFASIGLRAELVGWDAMIKDGRLVTDANGVPIPSPQITIEGRIVDEIEHDYERMQYETQAAAALRAGHPDQRRSTSIAMPGPKPTGR